MVSILRVLFLSAEAAPLIKVGGLGDVAGSLPPALRRLSASLGEDEPLEIDVRLAIPFHGAIQRQAYPIRSLGGFTIPCGGDSLPVECLTLDLDDLPVYLISARDIPPDGPVYTTDMRADGFKFTLFSLAALDLTRQLDWKPHIVHANDWHTAPALYALYRTRDQDSFFSDTSTLMGVHNLPYLGIGASEALVAFGLAPAEDSDLPVWARDIPLPLGLLGADHIVAVSPSYAEEILTAGFGAGLDKFLRSRSEIISGILNGLDVDRWNPNTDGYLEKNYSEQDMSLRAINKAALQDEFGLRSDLRTPLLAIVSRLDHQKGVDLVPEALRLLVSTPDYSSLSWQVIILGAGDSEVETSVSQLEIEFPLRARVAIRFDAALSRRIYAGADILLIPSRYEPCGMTQMIAMRYGCVPVARATGGLKDTILDYDQSRHSTGFLFIDPSPEALMGSIGQALRVFQDKRAWRGLQQRGMRSDFSWTNSARQYLELYQALIAKRVEV